MFSEHRKSVFVRNKGSKRTGDLQVQLAVSYIENHGSSIFVSFEVATATRQTVHLF